MVGYIEKVQIGNDATYQYAIGDTLFAICQTTASNAAKIVTAANFPSFNKMVNGIYIRVQFVNGNTAVSNLTLKVGSFSAYQIVGDCVCSPGEVIGFTFDSTGNGKWCVIGSGISQSIRDFVSDATGNILSAAHGMIFKGTIGAPAQYPTRTNLPNGSSSNVSEYYSAGWTYRIVTAGTYAGQRCEIGDLIIAVADAEANQSSIINSHWAVAQGNIDGAVIGPTSVDHANTVALFDGTTGKIIKDSGFTLGTSVPADAKFTDENTTYTLTDGQAYTSFSIANENSDNAKILASVDENGILTLEPGIKFVKSAVGAQLIPSS